MGIFGNMPPCSFKEVEDRLKIWFRVRRADLILQFCKGIKEVPIKKGTTIRRVLGSNDFVWLHDNTSGAEQFQNFCLTVFLRIVNARHSNNKLVEECLIFGSGFE